MTFDPKNPDDLRALQEQAFQLEELTKHPGWDVFVHYAHYGNGMIENHQKYLVGGLCKTTEEYQKYAGWVQGCLALLNAPDRIREMSDKYSEQAQSEAGEVSESS